MKIINAHQDAKIMLEITKSVNEEKTAEHFT
jgi:hypothetical protein